MTRWWLALSMCLVAGCAVRVFSPPTGSYPVESAALVPAGKRAVGAEVFAGGAMFGPQLLSARGNLRYGMSERLELSASPSLLWVLGSRPEDSHPGSYALRAGAKLALLRHVAITTGLGGGASAAGGFLSPDLGLIGAFENRYLIPFASARGLVSVPLNARTVHITTDDDAADGYDDEDFARDHHRLRPRFTYGVQLAVGLRLPLTWNDAERIRPSIACAFGVTSLNDRSSEGKEVYGGPSCALETVF